MEPNIVSYRKVLYHMFAEEKGNKPNVLTADEFLNAVKLMQHIETIEDITDVVADRANTAKVNVIFGLLAEYPDIVNQPYFLPVNITTNGISTVANNLSYVDEFKTVTDLEDQLGLTRIAFPVKIKLAPKRK